MLRCRQSLLVVRLLPWVLAVIGCGREPRDVPEVAPRLPYTILYQRSVRPVTWPFRLHGQQYAVQQGGALHLRLQHCVFRASENTRILATPLDEFSIVAGEGSIVVECADEPTTSPLRLITCSGALEVGSGRTHVEVRRDLAMGVRSTDELDLLPGENANPELRIHIAGGDVLSVFGPRGALLATEANTVAVPDPTARERYGRELEHAVILVEDALNSVTASFREGQDLSTQHAIATRQGNHEARARTSSLLAENATRQHRARELLRLRYGKLLACDIVREQQHLEVPRLSAAYYPRVRAELGL